MNIQKKKVAELTNFEHNPRTITKKAFERLKKQIKKLNAYKPLLVNQDNIVLGGNMRLRALKEMGVQEIECSMVETKNLSEMMEYALSDNDSAGVTDKDILANLLPELEIDMEMFAVHFDEATVLSDLGEKSQDIEQGLDYKEKYEVIVECLDELEQESIYTKLTQMGLKVKTSTI